MGKMPDVAPDNLIIVETAEVREDGWLYITGVVPPGDAADMLRAGVDHWTLNAACFHEPTPIAGRPKAPPITKDWTNWPAAMEAIRKDAGPVCGFLIGNIMPCKLDAGHLGRHDPAPEPDPSDHHPDWAIHEPRTE